MNFQLIVIGGVIGCFIVASIAEGFVQRGAAKLPLDVRERVFQRLARSDLFLRLLDGLGIAGMIVGLLRVIGIIKGASSFPWGYYAMAGGFGLLCLERILRSWTAYHAFAAEDRERLAVGGALQAAILVTVAELALGTGVCGWVFTHAIATNPGASKPGAAAKGQSPGPRDGGVLVWIPEAEALQILGKDKAYLDLIVPWGDVHTQDMGGATVYRRDDITSLKDSGLPALEELQAAQKKPQLSDEYIHHEVEPLLRAGRTVEAVKRVRELTGKGLAEAAAYVDRLGIPAPAEKKPPGGEAIRE